MRKAAFKEAIGGLDDYNPGRFLDVNLLKKIGSVQEKITETNAPIKVTFISERANIPLSEFTTAKRTFFPILTTMKTQ